MLLSALKFPTVDNGVLNGVTQRVVGVVSGVRTNKHIRQSPQPQQQVAFDGFVPAVGVEDPLLPLEDIQRRTAQPATFQCWNKGFGIKKRTAPSIDNERTVLHLRNTLTIEEMVRG